MPDISSFIQKIRRAIYGEEVRGSIADALTAMNNSVTEIEQIDVTVDHNELVDARTGADGTIYSSTGNAVRDQITNLKKYHKIYGMKSFSINAGSSHSSNSDRLAVDLQAGKRYAITMFTDNPTAQAYNGYVMYEGESSTTAVSATNITASTTPKTTFYIPSQNVTSIGYYVSSASVKRNVWFYVYDADEADANRIIEQTGKILLGKNLIGTERKRYPVYIPGDATLTWHFSDNSVIPAGAAGGSIYFYDKNGEQLAYYALSSSTGKTSRTVTLNLAEPARYIYLSKDYETPLQVEFGNVATDYEEHIKSPVELTTDIEDNLDVFGIDQSKFFTVNAGATHSSLYNQISAEPNAGDVLCFYVAGRGHSEASFTVFDENGDSISNGIGFIKKNDDFLYYRVLADGVKKVGMYLNATDEVRNVIFALVKNEHVVESLNRDNRDKEFLPKLLTAKRKANGGNYNNLTSPKIFTLAHFSDIHANSGAMRRVQFFKEKYVEYLDDTICTGDMVQDKISDGMGFWNTNSDGSILMCIGNHDSLGSDGWANPVSQQTLYDTYISPYADNWNAEIVSGKAYWYKDYAEEKIRLIAVDATVFDANEQAAQITWLTNALTGAKTAGYSVVGAVHFPPYSTRFQKVDCNFTALMHGAVDMSQFAWRTYHVAILDAVQAFIDGGGDFVCWLSGHTHFSLVSYDTNYPKQIFITNTCAMPAGTYEEADRSLPENLDAINVVCVDIARKFIKLLRYGYEWDDAMRHIGTCVLRYGGSVPEVVYQN